MTETEVASVIMHHEADRYLISKGAKKALRTRCSCGWRSDILTDTGTPAKIGKQARLDHAKHVAHHIKRKGLE